MAQELWFSMTLFLGLFARLTVSVPQNRLEHCQASAIKCIANINMHSEV